MYSRRYNRVQVERETQCLINGEKWFVLLYDHSCGGCMIETTGRPMHTGDHIAINLGGIDMARGSVVWTADRYTGIQFDNPILESFVNYMGYDPSTLGFADLMSRDRFGTPLTVDGQASSSQRN